MTYLIKQYKLVVLSTFSFILGCMLTINLAPIDRTCKLENTDREYNIMNNSKLKSPDLIILVMSAPKNLDKRQAIRETWLRLRTHAEDDKVRFKMKHYFVVGSLGLSFDEMLHLTSEQSQFNDILIVPVHDSYKNLTEKVLKSYVWLGEQIDYGLAFKYVLKCDDDSFVRIDSLAHEVLQIETIYLKSDMTMINTVSYPYLTINIQSNHVKKEDKNNLKLYWGYFHGSAKIKTSGKWKETDWVLCDNYLPYALGGGYILSKSLIVYLAKNSDMLRYYNSEDVSVGTWLAPINNIVRIHDKRFDTEWATHGCQNYYLVSHSHIPKRLHEMYKNILQTGNLCEDEVVKRSHYLYNWSLPPSKCCNKDI